MSSNKKKINWVIVAVIVGSIIFLGNQYFMVHENGQAILEENTEATQETTSSNDMATSSVEAFIDYVNKNDNEKTEAYLQDAFDHLADALKEISSQSKFGLEPATAENFENKVSDFDQNHSDVKSLFMDSNNALKQIKVDDEENFQHKVADLTEQVDEMDFSIEKKDLVEGEEDYFENVAEIMKDFKDSLN